MKLKDNLKGSPRTIVNILSSIKAAEMYCRSRLVLIFQISNVQLTYRYRENKALADMSIRRWTERFFESNCSYAYSLPCT